METTAKSALIRKAASIVLLVCFFLPLSKCSSTLDDGSVEQDYRFAFEHFTGAVDEIREQGYVSADSWPLMAATLIVFFAPLCLLLVKPVLQAVALLVLGVPAEWLLYHWTWVGSPQFGGILAMLCWALLMITGAISLWQRRPHKPAA